MEQIKKSRVSPNIVCLCVDNNRPPIELRLYHCYSREPLYVSDVSSLFLELERLYNDLDYPQSTMQSRSFSKSVKQYQRNKRKDATKLMSEQEVTNQKGKKATFVIHVLCRQHATWQGNVVWAEKGSSKNFRSALELLKLIDSALVERGTPEQEQDPTK